MGLHYLAAAYLAGGTPLSGDATVLLLALAAIAFLAFIGWCAREVGTHAAEQEIGYYHEVARGVFAREHLQDEPLRRACLRYESDAPNVAHVAPAAGAAAAPAWAGLDGLSPVTREQLVAAIRRKHEPRLSPRRDFTCEPDRDLVHDAPLEALLQASRDRRNAALD